MLAILKTGVISTLKNSLPNLRACTYTTPHPITLRKFYRTSPAGTMSVFGTLPEVERLSPAVIRIMGGNPGKFTLQGTNTYLVGVGPKRILIDTGDGKQAWIDTLKKVLADENAEVSAALLTHWHHDHVSGVEDLSAISPQTTFFKHDPFHGHEPIEDGQIFKVDGATLTAVHTPGHAVDHMCFFLLEEGALFTGDNVLGHGTSVFEDLAIYLASLRKMNSLPGLTGRGYPGHGAVLESAKEATNSYIMHRQARERQVLAVLREGHPLGYDDSMTAMELVQRIYKEVPKELHPAAEKGLLHILGKLEAEKKVERDGPGWILTVGRSRV
ncbi:beta-lactamase-like protein [Peziza echinospora]|nr:beta-lactamase-like protein [Peziza echinospora]